MSETIFWLNGVVFSRVVVDEVLHGFDWLTFIINISDATVAFKSLVAFLTDWNIDFFLVAEEYTWLPGILLASASFIRFLFTSGARSFCFLTGRFTETKKLWLVKFPTTFASAFYWAFLVNFCHLKIISSLFLCFLFLLK